MENKVIRKYIGKKVFIILRSGRTYSGKIESNGDTIDNKLISIIDNKKRLISFPLEEIKLIQEEE